jgi:gamma-glutamylcyclotransferase (GGCT)/AIG2-like uncharacterized protein YtfP
LTTEFLFAYGTLRPGALGPDRKPVPMARRVQEAGRLVGRATTPGRLFAVTWYPALKDPMRRGDTVVGDVFELPSDPLLWAALDQYEGDGFARTQRSVTLADGRALAAWTFVYRGNVRVPDRITDGDFFKERRQMRMQAALAAKETA